MICTLRKLSSSNFLCQNFLKDVFECNNRVIAKRRSRFLKVDKNITDFSL